jgi:hypothetical protein
MVLGETKVNLVLATSTLAGIINQSSNQIRRNTTLFSLAQCRSINLCYPSYEVPCIRFGHLSGENNEAESLPGLRILPLLFPASEQVSAFSRAGIGGEVA